MIRWDLLKTEIESALRVKQDELGLDHGGANLWPGTAAEVATAAVMTYLTEHDIMTVPMPKPVRVGCMQCDAEVTLPPVLDAAATVNIVDGQMRVSIEPLRDWEFSSETGWRCPKHVPVRAGTNPPEGVKGEPDPPSDVRTF